MNKDGTFKFKISEQQEKRLGQESSTSGISKSEIIRRSIDEYLDRKQTLRTKTKDS